MPPDSVLEIDTMELTQEPISYPTSAQQLYAMLELPPDSRCIRVLDIDRPSSSDVTGPGARVINGHLRVVNLDQQPSFTTLSYVWGGRASPSPVVKLAPHGCEVEITENCFQALWHIQQRFGAVTIWVDSISINQKDEQENEGQIPLMREIYSSAKTVYLWLGQGTEDSDKSMEYLKKRASYGRRLPSSILTSNYPKKKIREYWAFKTRTSGDILSKCRSQQHKRKRANLMWSLQSG